MRRKDREVTELNEITEIIDKCKIARIGMQDENGLYIIPMNFGYILDKDRLVLFFHSSEEGRKIDALKKNSDVCFEMDYNFGIIGAEKACNYGCTFKSIIGTGEAVFINCIEEKKAALSALMKHQTGKDFIFDNEMTEGVCVFKIIARDYSAKSRS